MVLQGGNIREIGKIVTLRSPLLQFHFDIEDGLFVERGLGGKA
jgi:hypothetical protein